VWPFSHHTEYELKAILQQAIDIVNAHKASNRAAHTQNELHMMRSGAIRILAILQSAAGLPPVWPYFFPVLIGTGL
jgi:hypothetical protein